MNGHGRSEVLAPERAARGIVRAPQGRSQGARSPSGGPARSAVGGSMSAAGPLPRRSLPLGGTGAKRRRGQQ
jgi:hypothetical protein